MSYQDGETSIVSSICIGSMMVYLLNEEYLNIETKPDISNNPLFFIYYLIPNFIRKILRRRYINKLDFKVKEDQEKGNFRCNYPLELSGWALEMIMVLLIKKIVPNLYSISMWPEPFNSSSILTHDIEPTKYAYTDGIKQLMETIKNQKNNRQTICLVSKFTEKYLIDSPEVLEWLKSQNILSHGYKHISKSHLPIDKIFKMINKSKTTLNEFFSNSILGFRSPRLQRGNKIMQVLLELGFKYSTSCIDSDRENTSSWGGGVGMIHPYFPPIKTDGNLFQEQLLEIPVSAPDCIFPIFTNPSQDNLIKIHQKKFSEISMLGGLYNSIIHAGVFNSEDSKIRMNLLTQMHDTIIKDNSTWFTSLDQIYSWWIERHKIKIELKNNIINILSGSNMSKLQIIFYGNSNTTRQSMTDFLNQKIDFPNIKFTIN
ncbi:MAG: polysaccharide deacetylase family protein [Bacteriovoracaceae bacterium]